jgi:hypothetical protein
MGVYPTLPRAAAVKNLPSRIRKFWQPRRSLLQSMPDIVKLASWYAAGPASSVAVECVFAQCARRKTITDARHHRTCKPEGRAAARANYGITRIKREESWKRLRLLIVSTGSRQRNVCCLANSLPPRLPTLLLLVQASRVAIADPDCGWDSDV